MDTCLHTRIASKKKKREKKLLPRCNVEAFEGPQQKGVLHARAANNEAIKHCHVLKTHENRQRIYKF